MKRMHVMKVLLFCLCSLATTQCDTLYKHTNILSEDKIISESSGVLGYSPGDLTLVSKRTEGQSTFITLKAKDGKEFACVIQGGNVLTWGVSSPPDCRKKGGAN
jgi:hypothetical protein